VVDASSSAPAVGGDVPADSALRRAHGLAMHGAPALPADFDHFPYADPTAKKGGRLRVGLPGTFDSLKVVRWFRIVGTGGAGFAAGLHGPAVGEGLAAAGHIGRMAPLRLAHHHPHRGEGGPPGRELQPEARLQRLRGRDRQIKAPAAAAAALKCRRSVA
jgi:hypothetical protein